MSEVSESQLVRDYFKTLTLLCVEDTLTTLLIYEATFESLFKKVVMAKNGEEGLEALKNEEIDIILTDYDMPQMNGLEMITHIRSKDLKIPIIFVTAIEDSDVIIEALRLQVTNFLKKPINVDELLGVMDRTVKLIIADRTIEKENREKMRKLQERDEYISYQEELGFLKELNILKNDFYYQKVGKENQCLIDFVYMPLDTLSGDAYSAREIEEERFFYLLVDGMGKGISAAFTSILMTAFVNYKIEKIAQGKKGFDLRYLINEAMHYIQPILLDSEMLAITFVELDMKKERLYYALFAMPPMLIENRFGEVEKIASNNPPMSSYTEQINIGEYDISESVKYLIYSDGLNENFLKDEEESYAKYLLDDFKHSLTREDFKRRFLEKIETPEDDVTAIFLHQLDLKKAHLVTKEISSSMQEIEATQMWYEEYLHTLTDDETVINNATLTFTEMIFKAHEHGNMGISYSTKHKMIADGSYWDYLEEQEKVYSKEKRITISLYKIEYYENQNYIATNIIDEGDGFDTQILMKILRDKDGFNGRGVYLSRKLSAGIYYNKKGNDVTFLHKL